MTCGFIHKDISILYGVEPMPVEELPKVCTCGEPLTYCEPVLFASRPTVTYPADSCIVEETVTVTFEETK